MFGRATKEVARTRTGRRSARAAAKGVLKTGGSRKGRAAGLSGARGLGKLAKTGVKLKAGKEAGRAGAKGAAKAGKGFGKLTSRKGHREVRRAEKTLRSGRRGGRLLKFGLLILAGLGIGALLKRSSGEETSSSFTDTTGPHRPESGSPAAERGQTAGSGTAVGEAGGSSAGAAGDDADRAQSDPSSGPLIGESHREDIEGVGEDQPEVENRIRTRIGEDERTRDMPRVNVEVNDGVAELRGVAPSEEAKEAAGEIAAGVEGVREVRNLIEVGS